MALQYEMVDVTVDDSTILAGDSWKIIEPVWWSANIYGSPEDYENSLRPFSTEQKLIFAVKWYYSEVCNGGHYQFYSNPTGIVWRDALAAFQELGIQEGAEIIRESAHRLGGEPGLDRSSRMEQLELLQPNFRDLDDAFYSLKRNEDLEKGMISYIRSNPIAFYFSGRIRRAVLPQPSQVRRKRNDQQG